MEYYTNFNLMIESEDCVLFNADSIIQYESICDPEIDNFGIPFCWIFSILEKMDYTDFCLLSIYYTKKKVTECNSIMNYKGIWNLLYQEEGDYKTYYDVSSNRYYIGINKISLKKNTLAALYKSKSNFYFDVFSPLAVILPIDCEITFQQIIDIFAEEQYDFSSSTDLFIKLLQLCPKMICWKYENKNSELKMFVFMEKAEERFDENDTLQWKKFAMEMGQSYEDMKT